MSNYRITAAASKDLNEILDYFSKYNLEAGERFVQEFTQKCRNLVKFPKLGRQYDDVAPGLRGILLQSYIILYQLVEDNIIIMRVVSGYRDLTNLFSDNSDNNDDLP